MRGFTIFFAPRKTYLSIPFLPKHFEVTSQSDCTDLMSCILIITCHIESLWHLIISNYSLGMDDVLSVSVEKIAM